MGTLGGNRFRGSMLRKLFPHELFSGAITCCLQKEAKLLCLQTRHLWSPKTSPLIVHTGAAAKRPPLCPQCLGDVLGDDRCVVCRHKSFASFCNQQVRAPENSSFGNNLRSKAPQNCFPQGFAKRSPWGLDRYVGPAMLLWRKAVFH